MNPLQAAAPIRLRPGDRLAVGDSDLIYQQGWDHFLSFIHRQSGLPFTILGRDHARSMPTMDWLRTELAAGRAVLRSMRRATRAALVSKFDCDLSVSENADAIRRFRWLAALDAVPQRRLSDRWLATFIAATLQDATIAEAGSPPSPSTLRRWYNRRGVTGERRIAEMVSLRGRASGCPRFDPLVRAATERAVAKYWSDRRWDMTDCHCRILKIVSYLVDRQAGTRRVGRNRFVARASGPSTILADRVLNVPSFETVRRAINAAENRENYATRFGERAALLKFKGVGQGIRATNILEVGLIDHTRFDAPLRIDLLGASVIERPWFTALLDAHSAAVIGWLVSFEPPSITSIIETIKRANRPKLEMLREFPDAPGLVDIYGKVAELVSDNGTDFQSGSLRDGLQDIGMSTRYCPPRQPECKGRIERFFLTIRKLLADKLPGAVGPDPRRDKALGIVPQDGPLLTLAELEALIVKAVGIYHLETHSGVGKAPLKAWSESADRVGIDVIGDPRMLDQMLGRAANRRLTRSGIRLHGLTYSDPRTTEQLLNSLAHLTPKRRRPKGSAVANVKVKWNPADIGELHVFDEVAGDYKTLPCTDQAYAAGKSEWVHEKIQDFARSENLQFTTPRDRAEARSALRKQIDRLAPKSKGRRRRESARLLSSDTPTHVNFDIVEVAYAKPRHDGRAPVVEVAPLVAERTDEGAVPPTRTPRPRARLSNGHRTPARRSAKDNELPQSVISSIMKDVTDADWLDTSDE